MDRKILFGILAATLVAVSLAVMLPGGKAPDAEPKLPWRISLDALGNSRVFGLTLGKSTLADARHLLRDEGKVSLFISKGEAPVLEAYFERMALSGLKADFVFVLEADESQLQGFYERGARIARTTEMTSKVDLAFEDMQQVAQLPIKLINYIPVTNLDEALIRSRFGEPDSQIPEGDSGVMHWIYPAQGLSISLNPEGKEVLQYTNPAAIETLIESIKNNAAQPSS
ncbi:hypothetical protein [Candidatus Endoriftia persephone]|jgi:hypothetical protein|uniref:Uncharacterized protein n=3 Tax=Gammaproteobacteria TaxID=1236 RepID=G2FI88_9GAMM|nr:hypothetical protein [Candidatus Endoriftia persephone]EGV52375.1 hypothetical protein Rifp1Sym_aj00050 [endosymbiont of Riftia pachyptila (vent Ph05)]EGW53515.1 hypothetical protein TevJSym_ba00330 [endosymbiont of Tevnia jerichonana (vent Tica)]USF88544.1 hypothetical protein L0Y14_04725 [Candidatus Endoriftia persephone]